MKDTLSLQQMRLHRSDSISLIHSW